MRFESVLIILKNPAYYSQIMPDALTLPIIPKIMLA